MRTKKQQQREKKESAFSSSCVLTCSLFLNVALLSLGGLLTQRNLLMEVDLPTVFKKCLNNEGLDTVKQTTSTDAIMVQNHSEYTYMRSPVIYAHVHVAKTAGTEINGELAARFERVCGHKGYSFDSYGVNARNEAWKKSHPNEPLTERNGPKDSIPNLEYNRGRVPTALQHERGYQDCDWISIEEQFMLWQKIAQEVYPNPLEFHVPCRDPVDLLLSMCNFAGKTLNCNITDARIPLEVRKCLITLDRFDNRKLPAWGKRLADLVSLKCFNPIPIEPYLDFMSTKLEHKRMVRPYVHRYTNRPRKKDQECLRQDQVLQQKFRKYLEATFPLFRFCKTCLGSKDDLFA